MQGKDENASFHKLLGEVSTQLLRTTTRRIDAIIRRSVTAIGQHYEVNRVDLRRFNENRSATILLSGWTSDDDVGLATDLSNEEAPWVSAQVLLGNVIRINNLDDLPAAGAGAGRMLMKEDGLSAVLIVPIDLDDGLFGALVLASKTECAWTDAVIDQVRVLGECLAIAHSRARTVNKLFTSETRLRAVIEGQSEFIVRWMPDGTRTWVNDSYCEFHKKSREELTGTSFLPIMEAEDAENFMAGVISLTADEPTKTDELRSTSPSGDISWQRWRTKGLFDTAGNLVELQSIGRDITTQKNAELALCDSESRYRDLVENSTDWIWELGLDRRITYSNSNVEKLLGYSISEILQKSPQELVHPDDLATAGHLLEPREGRPTGWEQLLVRFRHKDGDYRTLQSNALPVFDSKGNHIGFRGIDRDVTDSVRVQKEILRRSEFQRELAQLSTRLLTSGYEDTKAIAEREFETTCKRYGLSTSGIWTMDDSDDGLLTRRVGWRSENMESKKLPGQFQKDEVPWLVSQVFADNTIKFDDVDQLPSDASLEREFFEMAGMKSAFFFSAVASTGLRGFCFFSTTESRDWDDETVEELRLIANTLTTGCARLWAAEESLRSQQDLIRSQAVASLGSYSITFPEPVIEYSHDVTMERSPQHFILHGTEQNNESPKQMLARIHPDDYARVLATMENGFGSEEGVKQTYRLIRPDNTTIYVDGRIQFDTDEQGRVIRAFGIDHDVTDQVMARQKLERALAENQTLREQLQQENVYLRDEVRVAQGFEKIIGTSPAIKGAMALAEKVAPTNVSVLIHGETGTGKELIAQSIHDLSDRKDNAMISVNCAALSHDLIESELFGHEKGSFTGAHERRKGRFELAHGGTLFLDEIGELPGDLQAKLLRVLQSGEFERIGGTETLSVDVRILAATNKDLRRAVDEGEFRADLFYRIGTFPIELPPLREREEDIPALVEFLVQKHAKRMNKPIQSITARTIRHLAKQQWPGNVRELEGVLQRALISTPGPVLDFADDAQRTSPPVEQTSKGSPTSDLLEVQRRHIVSVLESSKWVIDGKNGAATKMGVAASTLRSKMKRLGITRPN